MQMPRDATLLRIFTGARFYNGPIEMEAGGERFTLPATYWRLVVIATESRLFPSDGLPV
jgi:hypothetical protein